MNTTMEQFWIEHAKWSDQNFGPPSKRGPIGPLKHLKKEVAEAMESPEDIMEYADCMLLILDAARRAGFDWKQLRAAMWAKHEVLKTRTYPPTAPDEPSEHIR